MGGSVKFLWSVDEPGFDGGFFGVVDGLLLGFLFSIFSPSNNNLM